MPRKRYKKSSAAEASASGATAPAPLAPEERQQTSPEPEPPWEPMFKALAHRGGVVLVNVLGMSRHGFCATLTALIILSTLLWHIWWMSSPNTFARFMTGFTSIAVLVPLAIVVLRWLLRPKLLVALGQQGVIGLRVTGEAEWLPPDALREHGHQVNLAIDGSGMHHAIHTFGLGTRTLKVDALFHNPLAAKLDKPLERLFDDLWQHACQHWAPGGRPGASRSGWGHVVEPITGLPRDFLRTPILAFYSLPIRPVWLLWRACQKVVDGALAAWFAWTLMRHGASTPPEGADWCPPRTPYLPPDLDASSGSPTALMPSQALVRLAAHLANFALAPGLALAFAWLLSSVAATPSRDTLFLDPGPGWGFRAGVALSALLLLAALGKFVGRHMQRLADQFCLGSLHTEWLIAQALALLITLTAIWLNDGGLSALKVNAYFAQDPGTPIAGDIVAVDSFIKEPSSFMTWDDWTPAWCSDRPESSYFPVDAPTPTGLAPRLHTTTRKLRGPHDSCMQGGAKLTVNWVVGQHRRTLGQKSEVVRYRPLPDHIPTRLCGRHHVGALGLRYVEQLRGCDPT